jgi:hypothetical protein
VLVLLLMVIGYLNGCTRACSLDIAAQIKIMREIPLVFSGLWFGIYLRMPPEKYNIVSWKKKKELKDHKDLLVSFGFYFEIFEVSSYLIYHVLFFIINIYGIDSEKNPTIFSL